MNVWLAVGIVALASSWWLTAIVRRLDRIVELLEGEEETDGVS